VTGHPVAEVQRLDARVLRDETVLRLDETVLLGTVLPVGTALRGAIVPRGGTVLRVGTLPRGAMARATVDRGRRAHPDRSGPDAPKAITIAPATMILRFPSTSPVKSWTVTRAMSCARSRKRTPIESRSTS